jgi:hypothetical protein
MTAFPEGITYETFVADWHQRAAQPLAGLTPEERRSIAYARYNQARSERVHAAYEPSEEARAALEAALEATGPQRWVVLTEDWCGDSAFSLPVLADLAATTDAVTLRILRRDEHLGIMDRYLTNGGRSIPKLIAFAERTGEELFTWGPRSEAGAAQREAFVAEGMEKKAVIAAMVEWYEEGGWLESEKSFVSRIQAVTNGAQAAS